jgi:hypothetical protein
MKVFNFEDEKENLEEMFRKVDLSIDEVNRIKVANEIEIKSLQSKMVDLNQLKDDIKTCKFES